MNHLKEKRDFSHHHYCEIEKKDRVEKDVFCLFTSMGQRKILSCHGEPNLRPSDSALPVTRVLHVARIRNVDSIMFVNRIIRRDGEF